MTCTIEHPPHAWRITRGQVPTARGALRMLIAPRNGAKEVVLMQHFYPAIFRRH